MSGGEILLRQLKKNGVDHFFANPGTEFVSLIQAYQQLPASELPRGILVPHEFLAVSMAGGYYLATKRPQAVMTHANVGAANALIGLIGAARMNLPLIFIAGMTARSERQTTGHRDKLIHWAQDTQDQAGMFRDYVKWEALITDVVSIPEMVNRAYAIATTAPYGPVALSLPRDVLVALGEQFLTKLLPAVAPLYPDPVSMQKIVSSFMSSKRPMIITNRLGRSPQGPELLLALVENWSVGISTPDDFYLSFPATHSHHLGYQQSPAVAEADWVLVLETDTPWFPLSKAPNASACVIHVGHDPYFEKIPMRGHGGDFFLQMDSEIFLRTLLESLKQEKAPTAQMMKERRQWVQAHKKNLPVLVPYTPETCLNARNLSQILGHFVNTHQETVLINELGLLPDEMQLSRPGSYSRSGAASPLGWGIGQAIGMGMANCEQTLIAALGDGVFYLSPIMGALMSVVEFKLAVVIVILNNGGLQSIGETAKKFYHMQPAAGEFLPLTRFAVHNEMQLEKCADLAGGLGIKVTSCAEFVDALKLAVVFAREKRRPVVINAKTDIANCTFK